MPLKHISLAFFTSLSEPFTRPGRNDSMSIHHTHYHSAVTLLAGHLCESLAAPIHLLDTPRLPCLLRLLFHLVTFFLALPTLSGLRQAKQ